MVRRIVIFGVIVLLATSSGLAQPSGSRDLRLSTATRRALIIGNNNYTKAPKLTNAVNDANDLAGVLRGLDFQVEVVANADRQAMERAIRRFTASLDAGDVAFFHFSGHGLQLEGENYLIPVDFELSDEIGAKYDAYSASEIHDRIAASKAALNIVTLDACRSNGFRSFRGSSAGLAAMNAARGSFLAFATGPGRTADDNPNGRNGRFTAALLDKLREPGLELATVFRRVREQVIDETDGRQVPWTSSSVVGEFYFLLDESATATAAVSTGGEDVALQVELAYWNSIKDANDAADFESYLAKYPQGTFTTLAKLRLDRLRAPRQPQPTTASRDTAEKPVEPKEPVEAPPRPGEVRTNAVDGLEYVWIPPGTFMMGCVPRDEYCKEHEKPRHEVTLSSGFWMSQMETTIEAYQKFMSAAGQNTSLGGLTTGGANRASLPVNRATWLEADSYCVWAGGRLPTEAEWEFAARGDKDGLAYPGGDDLSTDDAYFGLNRANPLAPVGTLSANGYGLHDMAGNASEWVADWYEEGYYGRSPASDPRGPSSGSRRVARGGSWFEYRWDLRTSRRDSSPPDDRRGFRCVLPALP